MNCVKSVSLNLIINAGEIKNILIYYIKLEVMTTAAQSIKSCLTCAIIYCTFRHLVNSHVVFINT